MNHTLGEPATPASIDSILHPILKKWFYSTFKTYSDAQLFSFFPILSQKHTLVCAPTGTGKTLSAFLSILHDLQTNPHQGIHTIYISPLKSLNFDIARNLTQPLAQMESSITVGIRVGDTTASQRASQKKNPPNILVTTPESLALLTTSSFSQHFSTLKYIIIDEIHHLISSKRGAHLSLLLESICAKNPSITRIGLSATLSQPQLGASFLTGTKSSAIICEIQTKKAIDIRYESVGSFISETEETIAQKRLDKIHKLIQSHKSTLVFCNTRQLSERFVAELKQTYPQEYYEINEEPPFEKSQLIGAHHSSLSFEIRSEMEQKLKAGKMKALCTSSSLELGIDIGYIDLVIQIGSPKSVTRLLQRIGRAGHKVGAISTGILFALDALDEIECIGISELAMQKKLEPLVCIHPAYDICMQWIIGEVLLSPKTKTELYDTITRSYVYAKMTLEQFENCMALLVLEQSAVGLYPKVRITNQTYNTVAKNMQNTVQHNVQNNVKHNVQNNVKHNVQNNVKHNVQQNAFKQQTINDELVSSNISPYIFYQNCGSIVEGGSIKVVCNHQLIGTVEEDFAQSLKPSDIFILGAQSYRFIRMTGMTLFVQLVEGRTNTIPRWRSDSLSTPYETFESFNNPAIENKIKQSPVYLAQEQILLQRTIRDQLKRTENNQLQKQESGPQNKQKKNQQQTQETNNKKCVLTKDIFVERFFDANMHYVVIHTQVGRKVNEALCTLFLYAIKKQSSTISYGVFEWGFYLCSMYELSISAIPHRIGVGKAKLVLDNALEETEHIKRRFRAVSTRSFSILRRYKQSQKTVGQLQMKSQFLYYTLRSQNPILFMEAKQEVLSTVMDITHAQQIIDEIVQGKRVFIEFQTDIPTPFSACMLSNSLDMLTASNKHLYVVRCAQLGLARITQTSSLETENKFDLQKKIAIQKQAQAFSYTTFWNEKNEQVKTDFVSQAQFIARKLQLDEKIRHELLYFCDSAHTGPYSQEFLAWINELLTGAIPKIWSDELVLFLKQKIKEYL
jgi:ATP-dependent helicase Lhr and Lhr-like helicase